MNYYQIRLTALLLIIVSICACCTTDDGYFDIYIETVLNGKEHKLITRYIWRELGEDVTILIAVADGKSIYSVKTTLDSDEVMDRLKLLKLVWHDEYYQCDIDAVRSLESLQE